MFKKIILKLLVKIFDKQNREITKISIEEEFEYLKFKNPDNTIKLLKSIMTWSTLRHWETTTQSERDIVKGYGLMAKMLLDGHKAVFMIEEKLKNPDHKIKKWKLFRINIFAGLLSRQPK